MSAIIQKLQGFLSQAQGSGASGSNRGQIYYDTQQSLLGHTWTSSWEQWEAGKLRDEIYHALGIHTGGQCTPGNMTGAPKVPLVTITLTAHDASGQQVSFNAVQADADSELCYQLKYGAGGWMTQNPYGTEPNQTDYVSQPYAQMEWRNGVLVYSSTGLPVSPAAQETAPIVLDISPKDLPLSSASSTPLNPSTPNPNAAAATVVSQVGGSVNSIMSDIQGLISGSAGGNPNLIKYGIVALLVYLVVKK